MIHIENQLRTVGFTLVIAAAAMAVLTVPCGASELRPLNLAQFAPIRYPFVVAWYYPGDAPSESDTYHSHYLNILTSNYGSFNAWADIGVLPLQQIGWHYAHSDRLKNLAAAGQVGVVFDELLRTDEDDPGNWARFMAGRDVKKDYPHYYVGVHGNTVSRSLVEAFTQNAIDHFYEESYTCVRDRPEWAVSPAGIRQRWKIYRAAGISDRVVWHFGTLEPEPDTYFHKGFTSARLEYEVQLSRRWAPEKAGVCFYTWELTGRPDSELFPAIDQLVYEYFLRPAPVVRIAVDPMEGRKAEVTVHAEQSAFGGSPISERIFLDTQQVATSDRWVWDFSTVADGEYLLTAHATTEDYYHGAAQVVVTIHNGSVRLVREIHDERPQRESMQRLAPVGGGEPTHALAVRDGIVYIGVGTEMRVLDFRAGWGRIGIGSDSAVVTLELPAEPERFALAGDILYAACGEAGVAVMSIANHTQPQMIACYDNVSRAEDVFASEDLLLVAGGDDGLLILDASDPAALVKLGRYHFDYAWGVVAQDGVAYVSAGMQGLALVDIADPARPALLAIQETGDWALRTAVQGSIAVVADWKSGVRIIDISDPTVPRSIGRYRLPWVWDVAIKDEVVYAADENLGLRAIDISDLENMQETIVWDRPEAGDALNVAICGDHVFIMDGWIGLRVFDISGGSQAAKGVTAYGSSIVHPIKSVWNVWLKGVSRY